MNNILIIEDAELVVGLRTYKHRLASESSKSNLFVIPWNDLLKGIHGGKRIVRMIKEHEINILFIHFSSYFPVEWARKIIDEIKEKTGIAIVVITNAHPEQTFGVKRSLQKPIKYKDFRTIVEEILQSNKNIKRLA